MANIVSPSLLSCDFTNIESELDAFKDEDIWFHLDIMDGHFVPNMTFGNPIIKQISKKTNLPLDAHFMVTNPDFYIDSLKDIPLTNFTFHLEATAEPLKLVRDIKKYFKSAGVSIRPKTSFSSIPEEVKKEMDLLLIMSVEPGFGGQSFIESTYDKIKEANEYREKYNLSFQIQVDGGVSDNNAKALRECGADNLVAGSFVFKGGPQNYSSNIKKLR